MRRRRWLGPESEPSTVYHCISRIVDRRFALGDIEKDYFVSLLHELADFCQVRVLTYCVMSNHFHILVEVPRPPTPLPTAEETLEALALLSGCQDVEAIRHRLASFRSMGDAEAEQAWLASVHARRWNLSAFLKILKQRFSANYNRRTGRKGTLWEERFRSVLVEGDGHALTTVAAYIDLNPIRAAIVSDPKDYPWCGYAAAVAGRKQAQIGLSRIIRSLRRAMDSKGDEDLTVYRMHLFIEGDEGGEGTRADSQPIRGAFNRKTVLRVLDQRGKLPLGEYLRCRVRYFCDGGVFGSRSFVERLFSISRDRFSARRKTGPRIMRGLAAPPLFTVRSLRKDVFG